MKCNICKTKEREGKNKICSSCRLKKWRKDNPKRIKSYLERTKEHRTEVRKVYMKKNRKERLQYDLDRYAKNREIILKKQSKVRKVRKCPYESREKRIKAMAIRRKTSIKYPLKGEKCCKCKKPAEHHHHTTNPMEIDKFEFLCRKHHNKIHGTRTFPLRKKCVLVAKREK